MFLQCRISFGSMLFYVLLVFDINIINHQTIFNNSQYQYGILNSRRQKILVHPKCDCDFQYCDSNIRLFSIVPCKIKALNIVNSSFLLHLIAFSTVIALPTISMAIALLFLALRAIAKIFLLLFAIAFKKERQLLQER